MHSDVPLQVELFVEFLSAFLALKQSLLRLVHLIVHLTYMANHSRACLEGQTAANAIVQTSLRKYSYDEIIDYQDMPE